MMLRSIFWFQVVLIEVRLLMGLRFVFLLILENSLFSVLVVWNVIVIIVGIGLLLRIKINISVMMILGMVCMMFMVW